MLSTKKEHKVVLLLSPYRILTDNHILQSLHITKSADAIQYKEAELQPIEISDYFARLPNQAREILLKFNKSALLFAQLEIKRKFDAQKADTNYKNYYRQAIKRNMHGLLASFKPYAGLLSWYHKIENNKSKYTTGPCSLSPFKPQLQFEVSRQDNLLQLHVVININGQLNPLETFNRYHFLLESKNEYFLMSYKDYQTLEWLENHDPSVYAAQPVAFARQILATLENDYTVNRNNLLPKTKIDVVPENRVMLSEISQKFLVLTPQWIYDGFLLDGPWKESVEITKSGDTHLIKRNREAETSFLKILESLHEKFPDQMNGYYYLSFDEA